MNNVLLMSAAVLGFLSFFEPCTVATHSLFAVRTFQATPQQRRWVLAQLLLSRSLLLMLIFAVAATLGLDNVSTKSSALILIGIGLVYLITRKIYLPVPHLEFFRLIPQHQNLTQAYILGLTLPACTVPLVMITAILSALTQRVEIGLLAGLIFAFMFTLPTIYSSTRELTVNHRAFLSRAANFSPYLTAILLWGCAITILITGG